MTDVPGLYFLGITWQWTRGSALIGWVKEDAEFIAQQIAAHRERAGRDRLPPGPREASADERASQRARVREGVE